MSDRVAGYVVIAMIILIIGFSLRSFNDDDRDFRADLATCNDVREILGKEVPNDIAQFCKSLDDEVLERARSNNDIDVQYLKKRALEQEAVQ